jgi:Ca2+-binding RTX toxin-like protein
VEVIALLSAFDGRFGPPDDGFDYDLTMDDGNVAGIRMTVDAATLRPGETLTFDGSAEDDGSFRLFGGAGGDTIEGSLNGDIIVGREGADTLTGNGGDDLFRYNNAADSAGRSVDRILDFAAGGDKIDLTSVDADRLAAGDQAFRWIGSDAFSGAGAASAGELRAFEDQGSWFVEGDTDGDGLADLVIELTLVGPTPLSSGDFLL